MSVVSKRNTFNTDDPLCYVRVVMDGKKRGRIFWLALVGYAVWLTIVLRHAISNNKPVGSLLVLSMMGRCQSIVSIGNPIRPKPVPKPHSFQTLWADAA